MPTKPPKTPPTAAEIAKAEAIAAEKAQQALEAVQRDQAWLDKTTPTLSEAERDELFRQISRDCKAASRDGDKIITACRVPRKLVYCVDADPFECANGRVEGKVGCKLSEDASQALTQKNDKGENLVCIDGAFVSNLEGGSYLSPYVPWGPLGGRKMTTYRRGQQRTRQASPSEQALILALSGVRRLRMTFTSQGSKRRVYPKRHATS